jgi:hypothetical protein
VLADGAEHVEKTVASGNTPPPQQGKERKPIRAEE